MIRMDPTLNNMTAISGSGRLFKDKQECYFHAYAVDEYARSDEFSYYVDLNITYMVGVLATIHNGTDLFEMGDAIEVDFEGGATNFTYEAKHENNVYVKF